MHYNFAFTAAEFLFNPPGMNITPTQFDAKLKELRELYPKGVPYVVQNLFGSHDANRIGSHIVNRGIGNFRDWGHYFGISKGENPNYNVRKPNEAELRMQKLFAFLQFTYVGAPMIYYGDEVGMWGGNDPDCRKPMLWPDIVFEPETTNFDQSERTPDAVAINEDLKTHYKKLIAVRNRHEALRIGSYQTEIADDANGVFAFTRKHGNEEMLVITNVSERDQMVVFGTNAGKLVDVLTGEEIVVYRGSAMIPVEQKWARVFNMEAK
jgi:glycosidase